MCVPIWYLQCTSIFDAFKGTDEECSDIADKELVTPRGLRTLSPANKFYKEAISAIRKKGIVHITRDSLAMAFDLSVKVG